MTKRWKLKTNSSNILLVLITLILVKAEWIKKENVSIRESGTDIDTVNSDDEIGQTHMYVGNDEIAEYYFHSSINNNSFILDGINKCLDSFQLITCVKMLLLNKVNDILSLMEEPNVYQKDVHLLNGIFVFKVKNETNSTGFSEKNDNLSLDEEITVKVRKVFGNRYLLINLLPKIKIQIESGSGQNEQNLVCFRYSFLKDFESENFSDEGRKKKGGGMSMMMMVPQLIMLGLMPFTLASLKAMVMNAVMINMMALNGAIFMTIRNLVFGPRQGDNVKYVNYGYSKNRQTQSPKPVLIIHSPAAFVKQPPVHKKPVYGHFSHHGASSYSPENYYSSAGSSIHHYNEGKHTNYFYIQQDENSHNRKQQDIQKRIEPGRLKTTVKNDFRVQNKNIYQRKFKNEGRDNSPFIGQSSYKTNSNLNYSNVNLKVGEPSTNYKTVKEHAGFQEKKAEFKPSPQLDSNFATNDSKKQTFQ